jgi:hypothetical protein
MYKFKKEKLEDVKRKNKLGYIAEEVGITQTYLSYVLNNKYNCSKVVAYTITKVLDKDKDISYYFERV